METEHGQQVSTSTGQERNTAALPLTHARQQKQALVELARLAAEVSGRRRNLDAQLAQSGTELESRRKRLENRIEQRRDRRAIAAKQHLDERTQQIEQQRAEGIKKAERNYRAEKEDLTEELSEWERQLREDRETDMWASESGHEAREKSADAQHQQAIKLYEERRGDLAGLIEQLAQQYHRFGMRMPNFAEQMRQDAAANAQPPESDATPDPAADYATAREQTQQHTEAMGRRTLPRWVCTSWVYLLVVAVPAAAFVAALMLVDVDAYEGQTGELIIGGTLVAGLVAGLVLTFVLRMLAFRQLGAVAAEARAALAATYAAMMAEKKQADELRARRRAESEAQRAAERNKVKEKWRPRAEHYKSERDRRVEDLEHRLKESRDQLEDEAKQALSALNDGYAAHTQAITREHDQALQLLEQRTQQRLAKAEADAEQAREQVRRRWVTAARHVRELLDATDRLPGPLCGSWETEGWEAWQAAIEAGAVLRLGTLHVDLSRLGWDRITSPDASADEAFDTVLIGDEGYRGILSQPADDLLNAGDGEEAGAAEPADAIDAAADGKPQPAPASRETDVPWREWAADAELPEAFDLPGLVAMGDRGSVCIEHEAEQRAEALSLLRTMAARLLVSLPPGRARFTFVDPVGLGETFAAFMHLADHDEQLVNHRIWTEAEHIDRRLTEMTEHMETVIQKYLRNEFATIDEYNTRAGELSEPYRFVVMADFPQNLSDTAARRLQAIISSGPRCGVYVLLARDRRRKLPQGLTARDLEQAGTTISLDQHGLSWNEPGMEPFDLRRDVEPDDPQLSRLIREVGSRAHEADRVEVPFTLITPREGEHWTARCDEELSVPVGQSGANRRQEVRLGKGVAQHALIAGKTGSGKSTLMHALITNLALWYSPDEVEFYLVDFKKGVEFKTYATHGLPHARAVAVESDREFGLSVLRRLDAELQHRGELYRELGVQTLKEYRQASGKPLPRTLLIIDEFQELFSEDDRISQEAAMLIDRLVRQGRAFGMHVLLGSQTLAGGGGLSRSTIGQMAVRIALQCNEADSQLIFDDSNTAARLLNRPGEAIYNDAGGGIEGNNPFQVAWLDESTREGHLAEAARLAAEQMADREIEPAIVFEGRAPADVRTNRDLKRLLAADNWSRVAEPRLWVGEPVTIKSPTAATLTRRSGSNVLMVGQREEAVVAISAVAMAGLAAQQAPDAVRFIILDATSADAPYAGLLQSVADALPHEAQVVDPRHVEQTFADLDAELTRRQDAAEPAEHLPACYVFIVGLGQYRELRKTEDDFSFSFKDPGEEGGGAGRAPDKVFADLLREGPALGMHVIAWCDTPIAVDRAIDRNALREFDWRLLFQISATDSSNLIDSPEAGNLGLYRALLHSQEQGIFEKFRPYELPDDAWVQQIRDALNRRGR